MMSNCVQFSPRIIRMRDAPRYLGMHRDLFNQLVRPFVTEIRLGKQGIGFDRIELDNWFEHYKARSGRPAESHDRRLDIWDEKKTPGLYQRKAGGYWEIDKKICGRRVCESTRTGNLEEAERYLARRSEEIRDAVVYGVRPQRSFEEAATKYLLENQHNRTIKDDASRLKMLMPYIGGLSLDSIHMGTLQPFIKARRRQGVKTRTINHGLEIVRRIMNLASSEWIDETNLSWVERPYKIKLLREHDLEPFRPLTWNELDYFLSVLPEHLRNMSLFAVNTGCREKEICELRWEWEATRFELPHILLFIVPGEFVKNKKRHLIICNDDAADVVNSQRGKHSTHVFSYRGKPLQRMNSTAFRNARKKTRLDDVSPHCYKKTCGQFSRAVGVDEEDRRFILNHTSDSITTYYSLPDIELMYNKLNKICRKNYKGAVVSISSLFQDIRKAA